MNEDRNDKSSRNSSKPKLLINESRNDKLGDMSHCKQDF